MTDFGAFKFLTGDMNFTDYGGKWCKRVGPRRYHVIELINWSEAGDGAVAEYGRYNVTLREVDLTAIDCAESLRSCGWELASDGSIIEEHGGDTVCDAAGADLALVECCHGYGAAAPLTDASGNNYRALIRAAIAESRSLCGDPDKYSDAMDRPVNRIGTSARNYMIGKLF